MLNWLNKTHFVMINHILYDTLHTWILKHCRFHRSVNVHNKAVAMTNILFMNDYYSVAEARASSSNTWIRNSCSNRLNHFFHNTTTIIISCCNVSSVRHEVKSWLCRESNPCLPVSVQVCFPLHHRARASHSRGGAPLLLLFTRLLMSHTF